MKQKPSMASRVRKMIEQGSSNKEIIEKLKIKPQIVYNMRYQLNKERGLGAIGKPTPAPASGIGTPPKQRRKVRAGTGITPPAPEPAINSLPITKPGEFVEMPITMVEPPSLWQRIKGWFRGVHA